MRGAVIKERHENHHPELNSSLRSFAAILAHSEGEGGAQEVFGEALAAFGVAGGDGFFAAVDVEAAVFSGEEFGDFVGAEVFSTRAKTPSSRSTPPSTGITKPS